MGMFMELTTYGANFIHITAGVPAFMNKRKTNELKQALGTL